MAKLTLLEIVQDILSDMVSDEVNSIDDTIESQSVAQIVKSTYLDMITNRNWPHTRKLIQLDGLSNINLPVYLRLPTNLKELVTIEYDGRKIGNTSNSYRELKYKHPDEFLKLMSGRKSDADNVLIVTDPSGVKLNIINNKAPEWFTSFNDVEIVCDSYDASVDDTLKASKTNCIAYLIPAWERSNTAIPDLPIEAFPALLAEAKSSSFYTIKQMVNEKAEQKATRQNRWLARKAWRAHGGVRYDDYGRRGRK